MTSFLRQLSNRWWYLAGALFVAAAFGVALYLQYALRQDPCPLCMIQRLIFVVIGVLFFVAAIHNAQGIAARIYSGLIVCVSLVGIGVASRHIWLQNLPEDQVPACGPGLEFMLDNFPLAEVWQEVMHGSGECAEKGWTLLGLGIPELSLLAYASLAVWAVWVVLRKPVA